MLQAEGAEEGGEAAPMEVSAPSTSGAAADSPTAAANGTAEAATPGAEGTAKKVKKEKKVCNVTQYCCRLCAWLCGMLSV